MKLARTVKEHALSRIVFFLVAIMLLAYIVIRANSLSITHDEGLSYYIVNGSSQWANTANNHELNSMLMGISSSLFGDSVFSLRLPNVLAFIVYLVACFLLLKNESSVLAYCFGLSVLLFNPFLLDFFSLARGYGLSLGLAILSLYFLIQANRCNSYKVFLRAFVSSVTFASLATLANLSAINFNIAVIALFTGRFLVLAYHSSDLRLKHYIGFFLLSGIAIALLPDHINRLLYLSEKKELYFGENNFMDTLASLISKSRYFSDYGFSSSLTIAYIVSALFLIAAISVAVKRDFSSRLFQLITLIAIMVIGLIIEHEFFDAKYPSGRSGLLFIPLYGLFLAGFLEHLRRYYLKKSGMMVLHAATVVLTGFLLFHGASNANWIYTNTWKYDAHTKDAMNLVEAYSKISQNPISISCHGLFEPAINYYIAYWKLDIQPVDRKGVNYNSDFVYDNENPELLEYYDLYATFSDIGTSLYLKRTIPTPDSMSTTASTSVP